MCIRDRHTAILYDFDSNSYTLEQYEVPLSNQFISDSDGRLKPHFFDGEGKLCRGETGNTDDGQTIHMLIEFGPVLFQTYKDKTFEGVVVYSNHAVGSKVLTKMDCDDCFDTAGEIVKDITEVKHQNKGKSINYQITNSSPEDPAIIYGIEPILQTNQENIVGTRK